MPRLLIFIAAIVAAFTAMAQRIAVLSDVHVTPGIQREQMLKAAVDEINSQPFDLVVMNGDLTNEGSDTELANVKSILDGIRHPLMVVPGNHENNWSQSATKTFFDLWGNDRFVYELDSLLIVGINCGPYMKMGDGHVKREDLLWLRKTLDERLKPGMKVLSFNHYPIRKDDLDNYQVYAELLQQYPVIAHINGHYHRWIPYKVGRIPAQMTRALEMGKNHDDFGYAVLSFTPRTLYVYEKQVGNPQMRLRSAIPTAVSVSEKAPIAALADADANPVWGSSIFTRLAFDDDNIYFGNSLGNAIAVSKATGQPLWSHPTGASLFSRAAVLPDSKVAVPNCGGIDILDAKTGKLLDRFPSKEGPYVADGLVCGNRYYQGGYKRMECRDAITGALIWEYDSINNYCQGAPVVAGNDLVFGAWDTWLRCLDAETGALKWKWNNGTKVNMTGPGNVVPVVTDDKVIVVAPDRYMTALDRTTGRQIWRDKSHRYRESMGGSADGKKVYAKTMDGELVAVSTEGDEFRELWITDMGIGYDHAPCVVAEVGGKIYAGSRRGIVTILDAATGQMLDQRTYGTSEINGIDVDPCTGDVWISLIEGKIVKVD